MTNIEKLDQACIKTRQRYQGYYQDEGKMSEHLRHALNEGLKGNFSAFTRQGGAREQVMSLAKEELEAELLKNLVRTVVYKRETMDPEYGKGTALFNLNGVTEQTPLFMVENGLLGAMVDGNSHAEAYGMERGQIGFAWMEHSLIRDAIVTSFVHNRYERNINVQLDDRMLTSREAELLDAIDVYALRKQNGFHI